jgi:hypothetical protein
MGLVFYLRQPLSQLCVNAKHHRHPCQRARPRSEQALASLHLVLVCIVTCSMPRVRVSASPLRMSSSKESSPEL